MKLLKGWFDLWDSVSCDHAVKVRRWQFEGPIESFTHILMQIPLENSLVMLKIEKLSAGTEKCWQEFVWLIYNDKVMLQSLKVKV
jgi:hypothetical protein